MTQRIAFAIITGFWLTMNFLLWRVEYLSRQQTASPVRVERVWQKILTSPDPSALEIYYKGNRIGNCKWVVGAGEEQIRAYVYNEDVSVQKPLPKPTTYTVDLDGNLMLREYKHNIRFYFHATMHSDQTLSNLSVRVNLGNSAVQVNAWAKEELVEIRFEERDYFWARKFKFQDLGNPARLSEITGIPAIGVLMPDLRAIGGTNFLGEASKLIKIESFYDTLTFGNSNIKVYKIEAKFMDRFKAVVYVSRAGEILKAELPEGLLLVNQALVSF